MLIVSTFPGDHADSDVKGFLVEYRPEREKNWQLHPGIIPYKGPNHQYRVQIPKLPTGTSYFVRIKVIDDKNNVLVETPEIRAKNEIVSIKCENDDVTAPRHAQLTQDGQFSLAIKWDQPDCGSVGEYQVELTGISAPFDIHRQTVTQPQVSMTNLLPGTIYSIRIRAVDRNRNVGPWSSEALEVKTKGETLSVSSQIKTLYKTESEISIEWEKLANPKMQYYDVSAMEVDQNSRKVERVRLPPYVNSHLLSGLKPNTKYEIGIYRITASTASGGVESWEEKPQIVDEGSRHFSVHWTRPTTDKPVDRYVLEYRLPNETAWRSAEEQSASGNSLDFSVSLKNLENTPFYSVRIVAIEKDGSVVARTDEMTVGDAGDDSCIGAAGVPQDIRSVVTDQTEIRFTWHKPNCDESAAPIDGYEYIIYESSQQQPFDGASYVGNTAVTINDLKPSTSYTFRVRSRSGNGHSQWSTLVAVSTSQTGSANAANSNGTLLIKREKAEESVANRWKRQAKHEITDSLNFYQLRIVLSPPNAFLVWTPLAHHTNHILTFKLAHKEKGASKWTFVIRPPRDFLCPRGVADSVDFCFHLKDFFFGVHYMSTGIENDISFAEGYDQAANKVEISQPRIEQQGGRSQAYWSVQGNTNGIYGYQLDIRSSNEREWRENGQLIKAEPSQVHYRQALGSLPLSSQYFVRVRAVDGSLTTVATSPSTSFSVACQIPMSPDNVRLDRVSDRLVRVSWNAANDDSKCQTYFFITGTQNGQSINERVPGSERSYDIPGQAQGTWNVEVRAVNSAGSGPSSPIVYLSSAKQSSRAESAPRRVRRSIDSGACDPKTDIWCRNGDDLTSFEEDEGSSPSLCLSIACKNECSFASAFFVMLFTRRQLLARLGSDKMTVRLLDDAANFVKLKKPN
ncbi:hypothetical protein WR25_25936 isoform A [Diploscapter pachys]|uniref:Fibronectin type-III domain-containing protein n=1 Tax=Diploscapter pachys TaxID=2018661 RepID=A0A2A2KS90_9BILA|nr:hypothetical protein WR25_25936 isoform A [Diploscapter pachys]